MMQNALLSIKLSSSRREVGLKADNMLRGKN